MRQRHNHICPIPYNNIIIIVLGHLKTRKETSLQITQQLKLRCPPHGFTDSNMLYTTAAVIKLQKPHPLYLCSLTPALWYYINGCSNTIVVILIEYLQVTMHVG